MAGRESGSGQRRDAALHLFRRRLSRIGGELGITGGGLDLRVVKEFSARGQSLATSDRARPTRVEGDLDARDTISQRTLKYGAGPYAGPPVGGPGLTSVPLDQR